MTKGELIDDVRERLNQYSDDSEITDLHISFLIDEARKMFIKQRYNKANSLIPTKLFQQINLDLVSSEDNEFSSLDTIMESSISLPTFIENNVINSRLKIDGGSYTDISFIPIDIARFPYVGYNRLLPNIVYVTIGYNYKVLLKGLANRYKLLEKIRVFGIFENPEEAWRLSSSYDPAVDYWNVQYPIDSDMGVMIVDYIIKQLITKLQMPVDNNNNATES